MRTRLISTLFSIWRHSFTLKIFIVHSWVNDLLCHRQADGRKTRAKKKRPNYIFVQKEEKEKWWKPFHKHHQRNDKRIKDVQLLRRFSLVIEEAIILAFFLSLAIFVCFHCHYFHFLFSVFGFIWARIVHSVSQMRCSHKTVFFVSSFIRLCTLRKNQFLNERKRRTKTHAKHWVHQMCDRLYVNRQS